MDKEHIGILGGSFDPVHKGHIAIAKASLKILNLNKILLIPCAIHSQKSKLIASTEHRLAMLQMAIKDEKNIYIDDIEILNNQISYTINTIKSIYKQGKNHVYYLILGADQLTNFCSWFEWENIINYVELVVFQRSNNNIFIPKDLDFKLMEKKKYIRLIPHIFNDISSTNIRKQIYNKKINLNELEESIIKYIRKFHLYIN